MSDNKKRRSLVDAFSGIDDNGSSKKPFQPFAQALSQSQTSSNTATRSPDLKSVKSFNDPVHTTISLDILCLKIVDTPQFQRLRKLKQLGTCEFVFPGAVHTRCNSHVYSLCICCTFSRHCPPHLLIIVVRMT